MSRDSRAFPVLAKLLLADQYTHAVIKAMGENGDPRSIPMLEKLLGTEGSNGQIIDWEALAALGRQQRAAAFVPVERYVRARLPNPPIYAMAPLTAAGGSRSIPVLREIWGSSEQLRVEVLACLLWLGTPETAESILSMVEPAASGGVPLLAHALFQAKGRVVLGLRTMGTVDERLVAIIANRFDELSTEDQRTAIFALRDTESPAAVRFLESIAVAKDAKYDILFPDARPNSLQTVRQAATVQLQSLGSAAVIDTVQNEMATRPEGFPEYTLEKMERHAVVAGVRRMLISADEGLLKRLIRVLGWLGDDTILADLRAFINDSRTDVADAAYEAEQRVLGLD